MTGSQNLVTAKPFRVLDVSAGRRNVWINRRHPETVYLDIRPEVGPDVVADSGALPFAAGTFDLVVFDPPHTNVGPNGKMAKLYGHETNDSIRRILHRTGPELARVLRPGGFCAFKWSNHGSISFAQAIARLPHLEPLFGHTVSVRTRHASTTQWVMLTRARDGALADELWRQYAEAA